MIFVIVTSFMNFMLCCSVIFWESNRIYNEYQDNDGDLNKMRTAIDILSYLSIIMSLCNTIMIARMIYLDFVLLKEWNKSVRIHEDDEPDPNDK